MDKYILIKMLYLADRESLKRWGDPITGDSAVSMKHGPVLSTVYDLTKGDRADLREDWEPFISDADAETHQISIKADPGDDELSDAEAKILEDIYAQFKDYSWKQMKDFCHVFKEYDPSVGKSSRPICAEKWLAAVGKTAKEIEETEHALKEAKTLKLLFGS